MTPPRELAPGLFWLGGFHSDMKGTKAVALDDFAREQGRGCVRFDYSGHGESGGAFAEGTIGRWYEDALAVYRRFCRGPQIVVGSSMGGWIALLLARELARQRRQMPASDMAAPPVAGLVLIGTKASADTDEARARRLSIAESLEGKDGVEDPVAMAEPLLGTQGEDRDALVAEIAANIAKHRGDGIAWGQWAMAARPDRLAVLAELDVPAAVVRGANDGVASEDEAVKMADALGVAVETISGVGHLAAHEAPGHP